MRNDDETLDRAVDDIDETIRRLYEVKSRLRSYHHGWGGWMLPVIALLVLVGGGYLLVDLVSERIRSAPEQSQRSQSTPASESAPADERVVDGKRSSDPADPPSESRTSAIHRLVFPASARSMHDENNQPSGESPATNALDGDSTYTTDCRFRGLRRLPSDYRAGGAEQTCGAE